MTTPPRSASQSRLVKSYSQANFRPVDYEEGALVSTRGQHLPALLQSRSNASLSGLWPRWPVARRNSLGPTDTPRRASCDSDDSHDLFMSRVSTSVAGWGGGDDRDRRMSLAANVLNTPQVRSQRLIGHNNPRYSWERYWKTDEALKKIKNKGVRQYYERNNFLIQHYMYIDRLLDSSLPRDLIEEYHTQIPKNGGWHGYGTVADVPETISEEDPPAETPQYEPRHLYSERHGSFDSILADGDLLGNGVPPAKVKRTPRDIYRLKEDNRKDDKKDDATEQSPLLAQPDDTLDLESGGPPDLEIEDEMTSQSPVVTAAIIINLIANSGLLIMKIVVVVLSSSVSVLASLVDAALDFLSTAIVGITTRLISRTDQYAYPIGRRRLEPVGVLVFSVIMITAFLQVFYDAFLELTSGKREVVQLTVPAIAIMASTVVIKLACWFWCRLIKNSSVQALAQDAMTDVVFNTFSIIFPLVGYYANIWWMDPLGGIVLSLYVIINWSHTANEHICNLTGASASADERNILLYLTMRFAKTIKGIQGLQAYHSGDKLNVEVDIVLDEQMNLRDCHDLGESLQYVLESVPNVDRAFVHMDYLPYNLPSHLQQDS